MEERITNPESSLEDRELDINLRPKTLAEFIGKETLKENLRISIEAAKRSFLVHQVLERPHLHISLHMNLA